MGKVGPLVEGAAPLPPAALSLPSVSEGQTDRPSLAAMRAAFICSPPLVARDRANDHDDRRSLGPSQSSWTLTAPSHPGSCSRTSGCRRRATLADLAMRVAHLASFPLPACAARSRSRNLRAQPRSSQSDSCAGECCCRRPRAGRARLAESALQSCSGSTCSCRILRSAQSRGWRTFVDVYLFMSISGGGVVVVFMQ